MIVQRKKYLLKIWRRLLLHHRYATATACQLDNSNSSAAAVSVSGEDERGADSSTYASVLTECASSRDLVRGKQVHHHLVKHGYAQDVLLGNLAVQMYAKCGSLHDAIAVFDSRSFWNVYSWTMMITANAQKGHPLQAFHLFQAMELEGIKPNSVTYMTVLGLCPSLPDRGLQCGIQIHARMIAAGLELDLVVGNVLITTYGKCRDLIRARQVFDGMLERDVISWNSIISAYAHCGHGKEALELFYSMKRGVEPNSITFVSVLGACSAIGSLKDGQRVHQTITSSSNQVVVTHQVGNALVHMYAKCGSLADARAAFDELEWRHPITWSTMMGLYTQRGQAKEALMLLRHMELEGLKPNAVILTKLLEACGISDNLNEGRIVHRRVVETGFASEITVATSSISMFSKCGDLRSAREVFDGMQERNVVSWNAMIAAYAHHGQGKKALEMYRRMEPEGVTPTEITYLHALGACAGCRDLQEGKLIHARVKACGFDAHLFVGNALVNLYSKCNKLELAREAFEKIQRKDVVSWNSILAAYAQLGHSREALDLYRRMEPAGLKLTKITLVHALGACLCLKSLEETKSIHQQATTLSLDKDVLVGSALVSVYAKCGCLEEARDVFEKMHQRNVVSWSAMIAAFSEHGHGKEALWLFQAMDLDGTKPNEITLLSVLDACASTGAIAEGRRIHVRVQGCGFDSETIVGNALINMYGKCGHLTSARAVFDNMSWRNVVSWTGMLAGYSHHGHISETMVMFKEMSLDGTPPNLITFVSVLFNCSHAGVVKDGLQQFHSMIGDFGIVPVTEHYGCMIDLLGRAGWLEQAEELIRTMPVQPDPAAWNSLLGACKVHSHSDRAIRIAKQACDRGLPLASAPYVLLSNLYASRDDELQKLVQQKVDAEDASLIEVKGRVHEFTSGNPSHPRMMEIREELQRLHEIMKQKTEASQHTVENGDVQELHSVKIAIAYGLIATPKDSPVINIVNNRMICSDCHVAAKLISGIVGRRIVVRDSTRFHHFDHGVCSCGDYY